MREKGKEKSKRQVHGGCVRKIILYRKKELGAGEAREKEIR
jgi:hypothetical protein